jgi:hypothetical protein
MENPYIIQLIGILFTVAGLAALTASSYVFGRPLTHDEKLRMGNDKKNIWHLSLNLETIASTTFALIGIGILTWSKFNLCTYLLYWLPSASASIRFWLVCR